MVDVGFGPWGLAPPAVPLSCSSASLCRPAFLPVTLTRQRKPGGKLPTLPAYELYMLFRFHPPHQLMGVQTLILREVLMGLGWDGCRPLVQLAWPVRSGHVRCSPLLTHSSWLGPWEFPEKRMGWMCSSRDCYRALEGHTPPSNSPQGSFLFLLMTLKTQCMTEKFVAISSENTKRSVFVHLHSWCALQK